MVVEILQSAGKEELQKRAEGMFSKEPGLWAPLAVAGLAAEMFRAVDEFAVAAYWAGNYAEAEQANLSLLNNPELDKNQIPRIKKNLWYARKSMGIFSEESLNNYFEEKRKTI